MWDQSVKIAPDLDDLTSAFTFIPCFVVKTEGDPLGANRYRLCVPTVFGYGEENWTNWIPKIGVSNSSASLNGDVGIHWPSAPGEMGFYALQQGDFLNAVYVPGGVVSEDAKKDKVTSIKEVKHAMEKGEDHLHYYLKTPSGHTLAFTDKVGDEGVALMHASGMGLFMSGAFKGSNPTQAAKKETIARTAAVRGDKSVTTQTADSPGGVFKDGQGLIGLYGQNGSGVTVMDTNGHGTLFLGAHGSNGSPQGPSIYMSTQDGGVMLLTVGGVQLQIRGAKGDIKVTKQVIQEAIKEDIETKFTQKLKDYMKSFWRRAFNIKSDGSGGGNGQSASSGSQGSGAQNTNMGNISPAPITTTTPGGGTQVSGV